MLNFTAIGKYCGSYEAKTKFDQFYNNCKIGQICWSTLLLTSFAEFKRLNGDVAFKIFVVQKRDEQDPN